MQFPNLTNTWGLSYLFEELQLIQKPTTNCLYFEQDSYWFSKLDVASIIYKKRTKVFVQFENKIQRAKTFKKGIKFDYDLFVGRNSSNVGLKFCKKNSDIYNSNM